MTLVIAVRAATSSVPTWVPIATPFIAALAALVVLWVNGYRTDRARRRALYADALRPLNEYREYPYAVHRRRDDAPSEERARIQAALQEVQERITHYEDLLRLERQGHLYAPYCELVRATRQIAGKSINTQWGSPPITTDAEMNLGTPFDFSGIDPLKDAFLRAVKKDLAWYRPFRLPKLGGRKVERRPVIHPTAGTDQVQPGRAPDAHQHRD